MIRLAALGHKSSLSRQTVEAQKACSLITAQVGREQVKIRGLALLKVIWKFKKRTCNGTWVKKKVS